MRSAMRWVACCSLLLLVGAAAPDGASDFLAGMDALRSAHFTDAATALSRALDADEENADYRVAHAVALIFSEKPTNAKPDLNRALTLRPRDESARLWLATATAMEANWQIDSDIYPFAQFGKEYENSIRRMSHDYGGWLDEQRDTAGGNGSTDPRQTRRGQAYLAAKAQFPALAAAYVEHTQQALAANPVWAGLLRDRAIANSSSPGATGGSGQNDLATQLTAHPDDPALLCAHAAAILKLNAPLLARNESTFAATIDPTFVDAYLARAAAATALNDDQRASDDLATASGLKAGSKSSNTTVVGPPPFKSDELASQLTKLRQMARDAADFESLVAQAESIVKGASIIRKRWDETYQGRLADLSRAADQNPDAPHLAELGTFLYRNAVETPGELVEPRASFRYYRRMDSKRQEQELTHAEQVIDKALALDPQNMTAISTKAESLIRNLQWADAETLVRQAMSTHPEDPTLMDLFSRIMSQAANMRNAKANALRTPEHWEDALYYYTRYPSQAELAQADQFDRQADQLWNFAGDVADKVAKALKGTAQGANFAATIAERNNDLDAAVADLQEATKLAPENVDYHHSLAELYTQKGLAEDALNEHLSALNLQQTSAAPLLRAAWPAIQTTHFKSARKLLNRAMEIDPADPRSLSYLGMVEQEDDHLDEARACFSAAIALDEAIGRLQGWAGNPPAVPTLPPAVVGLEMALANHLARLQLDTKDFAGAAVSATLATSAGNHIPKQWQYEGVATSMLPGENPDPSAVVPAAMSSAALIAWAHVYAGDAFAAQGNSRAAANHFSMALHCKTDTPPTIDAGPTIRKPAALAAMELCRMYIKQGNGAAAVQALSGNGISRADDPALWQQSNDLMNQAVGLANQQMQR